MVIKNAYELISFLNDFDPLKEDCYKTLKKIVKNHPHFHLVQPYFLKSIEQQRPEKFDQILSQTAIATYDRQLLYEFLEKPKNKLGKKYLKKEYKKREVEKSKKVKKGINLNIKSNKNDKVLTKKLSYPEWAKYLKQKNIPENYNEITQKFELFDSFIKKKSSVVKNIKEHTNKDDLSEKSLASTDELMTETLAKVFVKQKKFINAIQAYQVLSLKYPKKNSFFANQIKEIKRLQQLK
ncbi:MAG: hypothetical protein ACR2MI_02965 [Flavobacteriaceae bacterium]